MMILDTLKERIASFERKEIFRFCLVYLGICVVAVIAILVRHIYTLQEIQAKMSSLNKSRASVQTILTKYQIVQQQKNKVEAALKQNKTFNIQKFYQDLASKYGVAAQSSVRFNRQKLPNGYFEESLQITLNQIDTKTMCEFLLDIEQEPIVYTIGVDISKMSNAKKINLTMSIATLRAEE